MDRQQRGWSIQLAPDFAARVRSATRVAGFSGGAVANYFRRPFGPGWALVGDAGYDKDPITAQSISDAFHDAERCTRALTDVFEHGRSFADAMSQWQQERDHAVTPMYEFTTQLATLEEPPPDMQQLLGALQGNQHAMDDFASVVAATMSPVEFFEPENVGRIMAAAADRMTGSARA